MDFDGNLDPLRAQQIPEMRIKRHLAIPVNAVSICCRYGLPVERLIDERQRQEIHEGARKAGEVKREKVVPPANADLLAQDVDQLPASQRLVASGSDAVFIAAAKQIPNVLYEIGRLREITFRAAGEGTGESIDWSWFDYHYLHLFLWNKAKKEIAGAYRIGRTEIILPRFGPHGLYTSELFTYEDALLEYLTPGLELSRSFVRREYQRNYTALLLLWKGIGQFVVRNPLYKMLFGAVSISQEYRYISRQLMLAYLRMNYYQLELAKFAKAKNPPWVDLSQADVQLLRRYMSKDGAELFLRHHCAGATAPRAS
jgi:hypothetical protein